MRPDSLPRLWRYINLLLTYLLTIFQLVRLVAVGCGLKCSSVLQLRQTDIAGKSGSR